MSQEFQEYQVGQEIISLIEAERQELTPLTTALESGSYQEVAAAGLELTKRFNAVYEAIETIGFAKEEAQDSIVRMLLYSEILRTYQVRINQAQVLNHEMDEGVWLKIENFIDYLVEMLEGVETFGVSDQEFLQILERWLPHLNIEKQFSEIKDYLDYTPLSKPVSAITEDERIPEAFRNSVRAHAARGNDSLRARIIDKDKSFFQQNTVSLEEISGQYVQVLNDKQLLLLSGTQPDLIASFATREVAALDAEDFLQRVKSNPHDHRLHIALAQLVWIVGHGPSLRNECNRLGLSADDLATLFITALSHSFEYATNCVDIAIALDYLDIAQYRQITEMYLENVGIRSKMSYEFGELTIEIPVREVLDPSDIESIEILMEDLGIPRSKLAATLS